MAELIVPAAPEQLHGVLDFINAQLEAVSCPIKPQMQIAVAVEEIFVNIAAYAYQAGDGEVKISCSTEENPSCAVIRFEDSGIPYDPLEKKDPDTTLSAEERSIGGLGIFLVKKTMDEVSYQYTDNKNILILKKQFA